MTRMLSDTELATVNVPNLQRLLKAARARAEAADPICECCGERSSCIGKWGTRDLKEKREYVDRIKAELQRKQQVNK